MKRNSAWGWAGMLMVLGGALLACSDVGDSSAVPGAGDDATADGSPGAGSDANQSGGDSAPGEAGSADEGGSQGDSTAAETGSGDSSRADSTVVDTGTLDSGTPGPGAQDAGGVVSPVPDTGGGGISPPAEGGGTVPATVDAGTSDGGAVDASIPEAGPNDAGGADSTLDGSMFDASIQEGGAPDAGGPDSGGGEAGIADAGSDTGSVQGQDSGGGPTPCTTAPCAASGPNSVHCEASPQHVCTPTEALIVNYDIANNAQGPGVNLPASCYTCMIANACLDGSGNGTPPAGNGSGTDVSNSECGDPNGAGANAPFDNPNVSRTNVAQCFDALTCALTSNGSASNCTHSQLPPSVSNCYCGANIGSLCLASPASAVGVCATSIAADIGSTDPTTVLEHFTDTTYSPGAVGLAILNCALTAPATPPSAAKCPTCFH